MTVTHKAVFPQTPRTAAAVCTAAKTTYTDTANTVPLFTAGENGAEITSLGATPRGTVTATQLQYYLSKDAGVTMNLIGTELMAAYTMAQTTQAPTTPWTLNGAKVTDSNAYRLGAGDRIYVAIGVAVAAGIQFVAQGRDF